MTQRLARPRSIYDGWCNVDDLGRRTLFQVNLWDGSSRANLVQRYDINGDKVVNSEDLSFWLADAAVGNGFDGPYLPGDSNLDGDVDFDDFLALSQNFAALNAR